MIRRPVIAALLLIAALVLPLHGAAAIACGASAAAGGPEPAMMTGTAADCPACAESDAGGSSTDACSAACSSVTGCIQAMTISTPGDYPWAAPAPAYRSDRSPTVKPPPPRSTLLA